MEFSIRNARPSDSAWIAEWTRETFDWGDYVADAFEDWLEEEDLHVLVAADEEDVARALAVVRMLSPTEGWLSAARVHPSARRTGLGSALNDHSVEWIRQRGGRVARLATEADNTAAQSQVTKLGYRRTSGWVVAGLSGDSLANQPPTRERLRPAGRSDVDAAWMYWSTGEMCEKGRGLKASAWTWRAATVPDLGAAAREQRFFHNPAGWVIIEPASSDQIDVVWVATSPNDFPRLIAGVARMAIEHEISRVVFRLPRTGWSEEALLRAGGELSETYVYAKAVPGEDGANR